MPYLSICIPTYNRAEFLAQSLESIVTQEVFLCTDDVEVVVSDNCSDDNTQEVVRSYIQKYGDKIKYFRNNENVFDKNFALSLQRGSGKFLKLCNDTLIFKQNSLESLISFIKTYEKEKCVLFFPNNLKKTELDFYNFDAFVKRVSFFSTWIGGFGLWQEDKFYLNRMSEYADTMLSQTYILFKMLYDKKKAAVFNQCFCTLARPSISGGYNIFETFLQNYLNAYYPYLEEKTLSRKVYNKEKWRVLAKHVLPRFFKIKRNYQYKTDGFWKYTKQYHLHPKFYFLLLNMCLKKVLYFKRKKNIMIDSQKKSPTISRDMI